MESWNGLEGSLKVPLIQPLPWAAHLPLGQGEDPVKNLLWDDGTEQGEAPKKPKNFYSRGKKSLKRFQPGIHMGSEQHQELTQVWFSKAWSDSS